MYNCPNCGGPLENGDKFCSSCGVVLPEAPAAEQTGIIPGPVEAGVSYPKPKYSTLSVVGFCMSVTATIILVVFALLVAADNSFAGSMVFLVFVAALVFIASLIISIIGTVSARKKNLKGRALGIAGIVISAVGNVASAIAIVIVIFIFGLIALFVLALGKGLAENPRYTGPTETAGNYEVRMLSEDDYSEAMARNYYWDGDTNNTYIRAEYINDETKITSFGGPPPGFMGPMTTFYFVPVKEKDYYGSDKYKEVIDKKDDQTPTFLSYYIEPGTKVYFEEVEFTVYINEDVRNIKIGGAKELCYMLFLNDDGSITVYRYYLYFECSDENKYFYSKDGVLYEKESGQKASVDDELYKTTDDFVPYETVFGT